MEGSTAFTENLTEVANATFKNVTEIANATFENITITTMSAVVENVTEEAAMETSAANVTIRAAATEPEISIEDLRQSMDVFFLIINSLLIFFLQGGFAFLEAGSVRSKNTTNILIKNLLDILLACAAFWIFGYMFAYSNGNTFIGTDLGYICSVGLDSAKFAHFFWCFVFCATAATIVSGAVAERCGLTAYFAYSIVLSGLVYPVVAHWAWAPGGWLAVNGYIDFAGSGVVHHLGGVCGFVGAVFLGPRIGRFDAKGKPVDMPGHSIPLAALGAFILLFGFFAFNGSTQGAVGTPEDMMIVQRAVLNTMIGGCSSGLTALIFFRYSLKQVPGGKWSLLSTINGTLCGMITTCAFCNLAEPHVTFIVGIFSAFVYSFIHFAMLWLQIDDPLDAVAVHSGGGILGVLVTPLVIGEGGVFDAENGVTAMHQIWSQLVGILVITAWSAAISSLLFYILKLNNKLRVPREMELEGLDLTKHGESAYPAQAWREMQYQNDDSGGLALPPHMLSTATKSKGKELIEMKNVDEKIVEVMNKTESESPVFQNKMVGTWSKVNAELRKQMLNLEDYKDSEVVLTVKPVGVRKLSSVTSESDMKSIGSSELDKKEHLDDRGFTNDAFEDDDSEDYTKSPSDNEAQSYKETHFGGSWRDIDEEIEKKLNGDQVTCDQVDGEHDEQEVDGEDAGKKKFHSSTLRLDAQLSEDCLSAKMEFGDDSYKEDSIYEQLDSDPLVNIRPRGLVDTVGVGATTREFNNSRESSMI